MKTNVKSMTGYARVTFDAPTGSGVETFYIEVKTLNNRHLDVGVKMPERFFRHEFALRDAVKKKFSRGSFSIYIGSGSKDAPPVSVNMDVARAYKKAAEDIGKALGVDGSIDARFLLKLKDVFGAPAAVDADSDKAVLMDAASKAFDELDTMRVREGATLGADICDRLASMEAHVAAVEKLMPASVEKYRERLKSEITSLLGKADEDRIMAEAAYFAERVNTAEEIVRLKSHIEQARSYLSMTEPVGRKLDFLCQEFLREANTIASKAQETGITMAVIEIKGDIEKVREQVQNIE
ncbi:MAG: YicC family protein [Deltaproteobacteria bacterium]|nr:YicC family protein [Deltaproteobacteria bacterium]